MKTQLHNIATEYREPQPGELRHRVWLQQVTERPADDFATERVVTGQIQVWAKLIAVSGAAYLAAMQTEERITHKLLLRYRQLDRHCEVVHAGARYRIKRMQPLNGRRVWMMLDLEELEHVSHQ